MAKIRRAILSVYKKDNITELAAALIDSGVEIFSSGGTKAVLQDAGINTRAVSELTDFPEILDGRVKTLHPAVFAGILATDKPAHQKQLSDLHIGEIDLVVVNLYPFEETIAHEGTTLAEAIEKIDIGGPSLVRAAAKNFNYKTVLTSPLQYDAFLEEFKTKNGATTLSFRHHCALRAFQHVSRYDAVISSYLDSRLDGNGGFAEEFTLQGRKIQELRYGENPHQQAAFYSTSAQNPLDDMDKLHGKELSYNNILDLHAALSVIKEIDDAALSVIIKHNNPCGAAQAESITDSYKLALSTDPLSAFGGIVGLNRGVDADLAKEMAGHFFECILAPQFSDEALQILTRKKNLRLVTFSAKLEGEQQFQIRTVRGGFLVQAEDGLRDNVRQAKVVSKRQPSESELQALEFAWRMAKHVHSNAIVFADSSRLIGIGAGQMSRVDAAELAIKKAANAKNPTKYSVVASDAFFPFRDGVDVIAAAGATAVIQPGGSVRDNEVIEAANDKSLAMLFTGNRHFKH